MLFLLESSHSIYTDILNNSLAPAATEKRTQQWMELFQKIYITIHITPYIHAFVSHLHQFQRLYGDINMFNLQGLEKLNDETTEQFYRATNKKTSH